MIFWEFLFFLLFFVCGLFVQWNECSLLFFLERKHYGVDALLFCSIMQMKFLLSLYINRFFSYFTNILWDKKTNVYSHAYLTICFIELACYGSRDNVFEQIIWIWNWRKCRLNLCYMILTSAALNPLSCFCFPFCIFSCSAPSPPPPSSWAVFVTFCVEVGSLFAWLFYSVQATKQSLLCYTRKNKW